MYQGLGKKAAVSKDEAKRTVQAIYQELLLRDPWNPYDAGAEGYVNCLVEGWCTPDFVRTEVIKAPEYAEKELQRAQAVYASGAPAGASPSSGGYAPAMSSFAGGIPSSIGGIPIVALVGGLALLMLLKGKR